MRRKTAECRCSHMQLPAQHDRGDVARALLAQTLGMSTNRNTALKRIHKAAAKHKNPAVTIVGKMPIVLPLIPTQEAANGERSPNDRAHRRVHATLQ